MVLPISLLMQNKLLIVRRDISYGVSFISPAYPEVHKGIKYLSITSEVPDDVARQYAEARLSKQKYPSEAYRSHAPLADHIVIYNESDVPGSEVNSFDAPLPYAVSIYNRSDVPGRLSLLRGRRGTSLKRECLRGGSFTVPWLHWRWPPYFI